MLTKEAFKLAGKIHFHYNRKLIHSVSINTEIAQVLGPKLYKNFCKEIRNSVGTEKNYASKKYFKEEFLNNPAEEKDCIKDMEVCLNYSFDTLMEVLAKVTS